MSPKKTPEQPDPNQGFLVDVDVQGSGATDLAMHSHETTVEAVPGGAFAEPEAALPDPATDPALLEAIHKENVTRRRHQAQLGKHSSLSRTGSYSNIKLGDYLRGFGPVMERNFDEAQAFADKLEADRTGKTTS